MSDREVSQIVRKTYYVNFVTNIGRLKIYRPMTIILVYTDATVHGRQ